MQRAPRRKNHYSEKSNILLFFLASLAPWRE
jgi:hypothetical protein